MSEHVVWDVFSSVTHTRFTSFCFLHLHFSTASVSHWVSPSASDNRTCPSWGDLCTKNCVIASSHCDICVKTVQPEEKKMLLSKKPERPYTEDISSSLTFVFILYNLFCFCTGAQHLAWEIWGDYRLTACLALVTYCLNGTLCFRLISVYKDVAKLLIWNVGMRVNVL